MTGAAYGNGPAVGDAFMRPSLITPQKKIKINTMGLQRAPLTYPSKHGRGGKKEKTARAVKEPII